MKKMKLVILALALFIAATGAAFALTQTATIDVSATGTANCTVSASAMWFGSMAVGTGNGASSDSTITVNCTNTAPYTITLNNGVNYSGTSRRIANGTNYADYGVYEDYPRTIPWDGVAGTGSGTNQPIMAYSKMNSNLPLVPGTYTDTITVTVTY